MAGGRPPGHVLVTVPGEQCDRILGWLRHRKRHNNLDVCHGAAPRAPGIELLLVNPLPVAEHQWQGSVRWPVEKAHAPIAGAKAVRIDDVVVRLVEAVRLSSRLVVAA